MEKAPPRLHKWHFWVHVCLKGKRVNYSDPANDESNCITLSDPEVDADEWEPGYEDPLGISVEPNEEDGFVTDMEDHGHDWDEDSVHIEVGDELCWRRLDADDGGEWIQTRHRPKLPVLIRITQADRGAGLWKGHRTLTEA